MIALFRRLRRPTYTWKPALEYSAPQVAAMMRVFAQA